MSQAFQVMSKADKTLLLEVQTSKNVTWIEHIRHLLTSEQPNDIYLFLSCMDYLDPQLWAGTNPDIPTVLEAWEVERVMQLLDSPDSSIRRKVCPGYLSALQCLLPRRP